jgi:hypothetical protein
MYFEAGGDAKQVSQESGQPRVFQWVAVLGLDEGCTRKYFWEVIE